MKKYQFTIRGTNTLAHKFNGQKEEKALKQRSEKDQAENHVYRCDNGNIGIPCEWIKGSLRDYLINNAGNKEKTATKNYVAPRIAVEPMILDTHLTDYEIHKASVPSGGKMAGTRDFCIRPLIRVWEVKGTLISSLDKTSKELEKDLIGAGIDVGVGSNRVNGYGRFEVVNFKEIK